MALGHYSSYFEPGPPSTDHNRATKRRDLSITFTGTGSEVTLSFKMASGFDEDGRVTRCRIKNFKARETLGQTTTTLMNYDFSLNHGFVTIGKGGYTTLHSDYRGSDVLKLTRPNINKESIFRRTISGTSADAELLFEFDLRGLYGELEIFIDGESKGIFTEPQDNIQLSHTGNGGDIDIEFIFNTGTVNYAPSTVYLDNLTVSETIVVEGVYTTPYSPYYKPGMIGQNFKYNGKEEITDLALNWYHYGARFYDPVVARFPTIDPFSESYYTLTPYNYVAGNPIGARDENGEWINFIIGAAVGAATDYGFQVAVNLAEGKDIGDALTDVDKNSIIVSGVSGAAGVGIANTFAKGAKALNTVNKLANSKLGKQAVQKTAEVASDATASVVGTKLSGKEVTAEGVIVDVIAGQVGGKVASNVNKSIKSGNKGSGLAQEANRRQRIANNATSRKSAKQNNADKAKAEFDNHGTTRAASAGMAGSNSSSKSLNYVVQQQNKDED